MELRELADYKETFSAEGAATLGERAQRAVEEIEPMIIALTRHED
jgi:hypothetical protein